MQWYCAQETLSPLLMCDAVMEPETCVQGKWFYDRTTIIRVPDADVSACRSKGPDGVEVERMCDNVVACKGPLTKIRKNDVVEDFAKNL